MAMMILMMMMMMKDHSNDGDDYARDKNKDAK